MARFKKAILQANREYHSPDGPVFVDKSRLSHWVSQFRAMKEAGLSVPCSWGHDDDPAKGTPTKLSTLADGKRRRLPQGTIGYLHDAKLTADGEAAEIQIDVRRKADAEACDLNLAYVSPVIRRNWKDGDGKQWDDVWGHVDLVQHPVDHRQTPFERVDTDSETPQVVACALRMGLDDGQPATWRLADNSEGKKTMAEETTDSTEKTEAPEMKEAEVTDDGGRLKKVIEVLAGMGIVMSDDTNEENFLEHLHQSILTAEAVNGGNGEDAIVPDEGDLQVESPQFAAMSLERDREKKYLDNQHRGFVAKRLDILVEDGRCTPVEHKEKTGNLGTVRLSLDDNGKPLPSGLETWIDSREACPKGTFWPSEVRTRMGDLEAVAQPHDMHGDEVTDEEADQLVKEVLGGK